MTYTVGVDRGDIKLRTLKKLQGSGILVFYRIHDLKGFHRVGQQGRAWRLGPSGLVGPDGPANEKWSAVLRLLGKDNEADAEHLYACYLNGLEYFITKNETLFIKGGRREQLQELLGVKIRAPEEFLDNLREDGVDVDQRWLGWALASVAGTLLLAIALWLCVAVMPKRLYPPLSAADLKGLTPAEQAERREGRDKIQNDARTTLLQGLAALLVLTGAGIGAAVTLRQIRIGREQLEVARQQAQDSDRQAREQLLVAQEGQITERFTRAIDQLGSGNRDVRLGGIYALERIARDSSNDQATIVEVLSAYVREHVSDREWEDPQDAEATMAASGPAPSALPASTADVRAALTVLGRRPNLTIRPDLIGINLAGADLRQFDLPGFDLRGADLRDAALWFVNLRDAALRSVDLRRADLRYADLQGANLEFAKLDGANLEGVKLQHANLEDADLEDAKLEGAELQHANLKSATLGAVNLRGANLQSANLRMAFLSRRANLTSADLRGADLRYADLEAAILPDANLEGAKLEDARLRRANLKGANLTRTSLRTSQIRDAELENARLPASLEAQMGGIPIDDPALPEEE